MNAGLRCLAQRMDMLPLVMAIDRQPEVWTGEKVLLRGKSSLGFSNFLTFDMLPQVRSFIFGTMTRVEGEILGEVFIQRIAAGETKVLEQLQIGMHYYIIALDSLPGVNLGTDFADVPLEVGSAWWVHGGMEGKLVNGSGFPASFLIMSISPNSPGTEMPES